MIASAPLVCPRFIGRENELALIVERYHEAAAGSGSLVLMGGDAGIGKSRMLSTVRNVLEDAGAVFVLGQCLQHAQSPLGPFAEILEELHARNPGVLAENVPRREALAPLVRDVGDQAARGGESGDRRAQYAAIVDALRRFCERQGIAAAIEDAHWADLATLELLTYLAERITAARLLVIVTYRSDELHRQHPLATTLGRLGRLVHVWQIQLPALSGAEMKTLLFHTAPSQSPIARRRLTEIQERAEGNPLFAEELLRHVVETRGPENSTHNLPISVRAAVLERTSPLDDEARTVFACAAVIGRRFDAELLSHVSGNRL